MNKVSFTPELELYLRTTGLLSTVISLHKQEPLLEWVVLNEKGKPEIVKKNSVNIPSLDRAFYCAKHVSKWSLKNAEAKAFKSKYSDLLSTELELFCRREKILTRLLTNIKTYRTDDRYHDTLWEAFLFWKTPEDLTFWYNLALKQWYLALKHGHYNPVT